MKVIISSNIIDKEYLTIGDVLNDFFKTISKKLEANYGGIMEELWIDFELSETMAIIYEKPPFPFRFAKRVSGKSRFGLPDNPDSFNIGHFGVRPDFKYLMTNPIEEIIIYSLSLIYSELVNLKSKEKKLGGFNTELLCTNFNQECKLLGIDLRLE
jgi:hypothetical protein